MERTRKPMLYILRFVLLPFVATLLVSALGTWLVREMARRFGLLDRPGAHKQHEVPTPAMGGVAVYVAFAVGIALSGPVNEHLRLILLSSGLLVGVGVLDDLRGISANLKLAALAVASYLLFQGGICLDTFGLPGPLALLLTFLWLGLVSSAFNGVDNCDGAASGLAAISSLACFVISWLTWQRELAVVSLVLAGACLGFLLFNFPRPKASIFLGDSGSLFIGFGLSTLTVLGDWSESTAKSILIALLLVLVPLFDFLFILIVRGQEGRYRKWDDPIRMCARDHLSHRLCRLGLGPVGILAVLYSGAILSGGLAVQFACSPDPVGWGQALRIGVVLFSIGFVFRQVQMPPDAYPEEVH